MQLMGNSRLLPSHFDVRKIRDIIPVPLRRFRDTRSSTHSHPFQVSRPTPRTLSHKSSFISRTCNLWSVLPSSFPESYNSPSFKSKINKFDLISLSSKPFAFFLLLLLGLFIGLHGLALTLLNKKRSFDLPQSIKQRTFVLLQCTLAQRLPTTSSIHLCKPSGRHVFPQTVNSIDLRNSLSPTRKLKGGGSSRTAFSSAGPLNPT